MIKFSFTGGEREYPGQPSVKGSAKSINMYQENNVDQTYQTSCPGLKALDVSVLARTHGMYVPSIGLNANAGKPDMFVAAGNKIYRIDYAYNREEIGSCASNSPVYFAETGGERAILLWVDGQNIGGYDLKLGRKVEITLPKNITSGLYVKPSHIAVVSGSIVINDLDSSFVYYSIPYPLNNPTRKVFDIVDGKVQYEDDGITVKMKDVDAGEFCFLDDYGTQQYFNAESSSDKIIAINSVGSLLTLYGPGSIEFWQKGDSESYQTWQRTSYTINKEQGLDSPYSLASVNNTQFCIGTGKSTARCILAITGTNVEKISEPWLDEILNSTDTSKIVGWTYSMKGHSFYNIALSDKTITFDMATRQWHIRQSRIPETGKLVAYLAKYSVFFNNKIICGSNKDGLLYELTDTYYCEDYTKTKRLPLIRIRQTPVITSNNKFFTLNQIAIEATVGTVSNYEFSDKVTNEFRQYKPKCLLQKSDDGGMTFGNTIESSYGVKGDYSHRLRWRNLGMTRKCVLKITFSEDAPFAITEGNIDYTELSMRI